MPPIIKKTLLQKIHLFFSEMAISIALKIPDSKIDALQTMKYMGHERKSWLHTSFGFEKELNLKLHCLWLYELIPSEDLNNESVSDFCEDFKSVGRFLSSGRNVKESMEEFAGSSGTINYGMLDFLKNPKKYKGQWIDNVYLEIDYFGYEFIGFKFCIFPTEKFYENFKKIISSNHYEETYIYPKFFPWKKWFFAINARMFPGSRRKRVEVEELIQNIKKEFFYVSKSYIKGTFFKKDYVIPSVELWETNEETLSEVKESDEDVKKRVFSVGENGEFIPPPQTLNQKIDASLEGLGLKRRYFGIFKSPNYSFSVNMPHFDEKKYDLKIIINKKPEKSEYLRGEWKDFVDTVLLKWTFKSYLLDGTVFLNETKNKLLKNKNKIFRKSIFNIRREIFIQKLTSVRAIEILLNNTAEKNSYLETFVSKFGTFQQNFDSVFNSQLDYQKKLFLRIQTNLDKYLEEITELFSAESNYGLQKKVLVLTVLAIIVALLQLFPELKDYKDNIDYLKKLFIQK
jgi:hypothetical protein